MCLMIAFTLAALVVSIKYYGRHRGLRIFTYYIAASLLQDLSALYILLCVHSGQLQTDLLEISVNTFMLFDFIVCNFFILHYISSPLRRRIIRLNGLLFLGLLISFCIRLYPRLFGLSLGLSLVPYQCIFLILPCLLFFYELFLTVNPQPLKNQPAFWVVTGILFLHACDVPLMLTVPFLQHYAQAAYSLNYILYSLLFILLIRAYLCTPTSLPRAAQY